MELRMSLKERDRIKVLEQVKSGLIDQIQAGEMLGLSTRQVRRLRRRYEAEGDAGLVNKSRGRVSNRLTPPDVKRKAQERLEGLYKGFGPTFAAEKLAERDGIKVSRETVRSWIAELGLAGPGRKKHPHRQRRPRRECFGELVQADTSDHDWLEGRGPRMSLVTMIDDATGHKMARFFPSDSGTANRGMIKAWIEAHGRPAALYTDHAGHFRQSDTAAHTAGPTQIERALGELNIGLIVAHSPQAKGRVERAFQTLQDRLVKALRLARISTIEAANAWLPSYLAKHNARFVRLAADDANAHRAYAGDAQALARICAHHYERVLSKTLTCQFKGRLLVVLTQSDQPRYALRAQRVKVMEHLDGKLELLWGAEALPFKTFERHQHLNASRVADDKLLNARVDSVLAKEATRLRKMQAQVASHNKQTQLRTKTSAR